MPGVGVQVWIEGSLSPLRHRPHEDNSLQNGHQLSSSYINYHHINYHINFDHENNPFKVSAFMLVATIFDFAVWLCCGHIKVGAHENSQDARADLVLSF